MNDGSSSNVAPLRLDIANEHDVLKLLRVVRHSQLDEANKNQLRDLVFTLQSDKEETLLKLSPLLASLPVRLVGITPASDLSDVDANNVPSQPTDDNVAPVPPIGFGRLQPVFKISPKPAKATKVVPPTPSPTAMATPTVASTTEPAETLATDQKTTSVKPEPIAPNTSVAVTPPQKSTTSSPSAETTPPKDVSARINEIKQTVNQQAGNVVHLVENTGDIGREYMDALLGAMKAPAGSAASVEAMNRLETAFSMVCETLTAQSLSPKSDETVAANPTPATPNLEPKPTVAPAVTPKPQTAPQTAPTHKGPLAASRLSLASKKRKQEPKTQEEVAQSEMLRSVASLDSSLARQNRITRIQAPSPAQPEKDNSLMSADVSNGLRQLLQQWKIFSSRSLFGKGVQGVEHPLYQTLKDTSMSLVMFGRYEGSTPEIERDLRNHINGWKFEQGVMYDMTETFEHYLRRVVKTILDKQSTAQ